MRLFGREWPDEEMAQRRARLFGTEKHKLAYELHEQGLTWKDIGLRMGFSRGYVHRLGIQYKVWREQL